MRRWRCECSGLKRFALQIARGKLNGVNTGVGVKAVHCIEISKHAMETGHHYIAVEWAEMALNLVKNGDNSIDVHCAWKAIAAAVSAVSFFLYFLNQMIKLFYRRDFFQHDRSHQQSEAWEPYFYEEEIKTVSDPAKRHLRKREQYERHKLKQENNFAGINFWGICQGKPHQVIITCVQ